jgi:large subunit ribosomal protein L34
MKLQCGYHDPATWGPVHYRGSHSLATRGNPAIKRTFQPKKRYRRRVNGFLRRMSARGGVRVVRNRRRKGRLRLSS